MVTHSRAEREACVQALRDAGPEAPTLCGEWTTRDLAAHLVVREGHPVASLGILFAWFRPMLQRTQDKIAARDYEDLLNTIQSGPPLLSPFKFPGVDTAANLAEYFVHCEDVRRAGDEVSARELPAARQRALWKIAERLGSMLFRSSSVGVHFEVPDLASVTVIDRPDAVTLRGAPAEILLYAYGRKDVAQVEVIGSQEAVATFSQLRLGI